MTIIKEILFWSALILGTISLISIMSFVTWKCFCLFLDSCKNANMLRKIIKDYAQKYTCRKITEENINLKKMGIDWREKNNDR